MSQARTVVLDSESVQALADPAHPKHRRVLVVNRLRIDDVTLDTLAANDAAGIRSSLGVSVVDAHLGAVLGATAGPHAVLSSDADDLRRIAEHLGAAPTVLAV